MAVQTIRIKYVTDDKDLKSTNQVLEEQGKITNENAKQFDEMGDSVEDAAKKAGDALDVFGGKFGALGELVTNFSLVAAGALVVDGIIQGTEALVELNARVRETTQSVKVLFPEADANELAARVRAVADTFDKDFDEVLEAVNTNAKAFGVSGVESLNLIEEGFRKGADTQGEFLSILTQYPDQLRAAGLEADEFIAIQSQTAQQGFFSDKGIDTLKEGLLRLREFTPATRDAINAIGLSGDEIQQQIESGQISVFEAIQQISGRIGELPAQSNEVGTAIADIFGGAGEDASVRFIAGLEGINLELEELENTLSSVQESTLRFEKASESLAQSINEENGALSNLIAGWENYKAVTAENLQQANEFNTQALTETENSILSLGSALEQFGLGGGGITALVTQITDVQNAFDDAGRQRVETFAQNNELITQAANEQIAIARQTLEDIEGLSDEEIAIREQQVEEEINLIRQKQTAEVNANNAEVELARKSAQARVQVIQERFEDSTEEEKLYLEGLLIENQSFLEELDARAAQFQTSGLDALRSGLSGANTAFIEAQIESNAEQDAEDKKANAKRVDNREKANRLLEDLAVRALEDDREREIAAAELATKRKIEQAQKDGERVEEIEAAITEEKNRKIAEINLKFNLLGLEENARISQLEARQEIGNAEQLALRLAEIELDRLEQIRALRIAAGEDTAQVDNAIIQAKQTQADAELAIEIALLDETQSLNEAAIETSIENERQRQNALTELAIQGLKDRIAAEQAAGNDITALKTELARLERAQAEELQAQAREDLQVRVDQFNTFVDLSTQAVNALNEVLAAQNEKELRRTEQREQAKLDELNKQLENERLTEKERELINNAIIAQEEAKEEAIRALKEKQAKQDKAVAIFEAGLNVPLAFLSTLARTGNPIIAGITGALAAAELVKIISTPIPEFAEGVKNFGGGPAIVGDGGESEVVRVGNKFYKTDDKPTLVNLPAGSDVIPMSKLPTALDMEEMPGGKQIAAMNQKIADAVFMSNVYAGKHDHSGKPFRDVESIPGLDSNDYMKGIKSRNRLNEESTRALIRAQKMNAEIIVKGVTKGIRNGLNGRGL